MDLENGCCGSPTPVFSEEKDQMIILYICPIGMLVKGSLAQWICSMKALPSQKCCMTFIQNLNSFMIHFKAAIFLINVITLF